MSFNGHIETLKSKHQILESKIRDSYLSSKDNTRLTELKKQKLQLKEKISNLTSQQSN